MEASLPSKMILNYYSDTITGVFWAVLICNSRAGILSLRLHTMKKGQLSTTRKCIAEGTLGECLYTWRNIFDN